MENFQHADSILKVVVITIAFGVAAVAYTIPTIVKKSKSKSKAVIRVLVDMDGVLCDFEQQVLSLYQRQYPGEPVISLDDRRLFHVASQYERQFGQLPKERILEIIHSKGFFESLPPVQGSVEAIKSISSLPNVEVFFCTSPLTKYEYVVTEKFRWIENHFGMEWTKKIIMTKDKTLVKGDLLIDDKPEVIGHVPNPEWEHVIFSAGCNEHIPTKRRIRNWETNEWKKAIGDVLGIMKDSSKSNPIIVPEEQTQVCNKRKGINGKNAVTK